MPARCPVKSCVWRCLGWNGTVLQEPNWHGPPHPLNPGALMSETYRPHYCRYRCQTVGGDVLKCREDSYGADMACYIQQATTCKHSHPQLCDYYHRKACFMSILVILVLFPSELRQNCALGLFPCYFLFG